LNDGSPTHVDNTVHIASQHVKGMIKNVAEDKLRYRVLHTAARLTRGQRQRRLRIPAAWPWADQITAAFTRIAAIPAPG
jgi:hypothetical protein